MERPTLGWHHFQVRRSTVMSSSIRRLRCGCTAGTTAQRPDPAANGDIRYNSTTSVLRLRRQCWGAIGGGATGGGSDAVFYENSLTVTTSYTITASSGAHAVGPLKLNRGYGYCARHICSRYQLTMAITIDGDNGISGVTGTATTPALQGTDSNTGIVFQERMRFRLQLAAALGQQLIAVATLA